MIEPPSDRRRTIAPPPLTIGRVARRAGVNRETIRYYQRRGLIAEPARPAAGFRHYPEETVARVRFIKRAQGLGFSLREIGELLDLGERNCEAVRALAERKYREIDRRMADLAAMKAALQRLTADCANGDLQTPCPIVRALEEEEKGEA